MDSWEVLVPSFETWMLWTLNLRPSGPLLEKLVDEESFRLHLGEGGLFHRTGFFIGLESEEFLFDRAFFGHR